jgi:ABC-type transport system involved in multi-copper enzyme maturation permease subunit
MNRARSFSPLIMKEVRALLPLWAGTMVALGAAFALHRRTYSDLALVGYVAGAVSLGAHSIGHEYGHRMLPTLLAQPAPRWRLFAAKMLVVGAMLATFAIAASMVFSSDRFRGNDGIATLVLPLLASLFTTPLLTMLCRNTLAGAVLGVSGPMTLWVVAMIVAWWGFGVDADSVTTWFLNRWVLIATLACPILAALSWRAFSRIEAVEGMPVTLALPRWTGTRPGARRPAPWRALIAKELHLQQMTVAITLFYGVIWAIAVAVRNAVPSSVALPLEAVLLLYCLGLAIVIGALASAEERQQGTLEMQLLQPVNAMAQWAVKCVVVLALAVLLGVVLPTALITTVSVNTGSNPIVRMSLNLVLLVIVLTSSSLFLSSLTSSAVRAMAWAVPVGIGAAIFIQTARDAIVSVSIQLGKPLPADHTEASIAAGRVLPVLVVPVLLWFAYVNHTSAEHPLRRTSMQIGVLAALIVTSIVAAGALI